MPSGNSKSKVVAGSAASGVEVDDLGDAGHLAADRLDEPGDDAVEPVDRDLDVVVGAVDVASRPRAGWSHSTTIASRPATRSVPEIQQSPVASTFWQ